MGDLKTKDVQAMLAAGIQPVIEFTKAIEEHECYAEPGMRARMTSLYLEDTFEDGSELWRGTVEFHEFEGHNLPLEARTYYGYYSPVETYYFGGDFAEAKVLDAGEVLGLYAEWRASGGSQSYVAWLEALVLALRGGTHA